MTREEFLQKWGTWGQYDEMQRDIDSLSLPPAEGAEHDIEAMRKCLHHYVNVDEVNRYDMLVFGAMRDYANEFAAQQQPPAEGAEETNKMIGQTKDSISKRYNKNYWEILEDYHSNGRLTTNDFIDELLQEYAALHAQRLAEKMVEEKLREELALYHRWIQKNKYTNIIHSHHECAAEYLKSRLQRRWWGKSARSVNTEACPTAYKKR